MNRYLLYGCGKRLKFTLEKFDIDYSLMDFTDSNCDMWNKEYVKGKKIISPETVDLSKYSHYIIGTEKYSNEVRNIFKNMGVNENQIVPFEYINGLWERWKKKNSHEIWKKSQEDEHISIIKNWYMDGNDALCIINVSNLIEYELEIISMDILLTPKLIEVVNLSNNNVICQFSSKEKVYHKLESNHEILKIRIKNAIVGIPWLTMRYFKSDALKLTESLKLSKQFLSVYSSLQEFPYYDEDYTVISRQKDIGGTILDVGANYGQSLFAFYNMVNSKIISFEVRPDLCEVLLILKQWIDNDNRIEIINSGVSSKEEELLWYEPDNPSVCGSFDANFINGRKLGMEIHKKVMKCRPLDDLINGYNDIWFIKMDVEGLEYEALQGARGIITNNHPVILIEQNEKMNDIQELLIDEYDMFFYDLYSDRFMKKRVSRLNCWLIPKAEYRNNYVKRLVDGRI